MSKGRTEFDLPVDIIQHIQSFLSPKEATKTCILSKPWFNACETPPVLRLFQPDFRDRDQFWNFSTKSIQRYKDLNLKLDELFLRIDNDSIPSNAITILDELITDALKIGVNVLRLDLLISHDYVLPAQIFAATSLTGLFVSFGKISPQLVLGSPLCSRLKSLELFCVRNAQQIVGDVIRGCPLIEYLELWFYKDSSLTTRVTVDVSKLRKLVKLCVHGDVRLEFEDVDVELSTYGGRRIRNVPEFRYLLELDLSCVQLPNKFFSSLSSIFPCLEKLCVGWFPSFEDIQISSHSLRYLKLKGVVFKEVRLDVPSMSKFFFSGPCIPCLYFGTAVASKDLKCHVKLDFKRDVCKGYLELKNFLTKLSLSDISLYIVLSAECTVSAELIPSFPIPVVNDVQFTEYGPLSWSMSSSLLRRLFWSCRPRFISVAKYEPTRQQVLYEQLTQNDTKDLFCMYNLEKVELEIFEDNVKQWQTIPSEKLINSPKIPHNGKNIRFRLSWGTGGLTG